MIFVANGCHLRRHHVRSLVSLNDDRGWASRIYRERAEAIDEDQNVTYFFLKDYQEVCRYLRRIGYGTKGKAEPMEQQVARELEPGAYCDLRTTVRGKRSTQDIAVFVYRDPTGNLFGSGLVVVSFDIGCELAKKFANAWFEKGEKFMNEALFK